MGRGSCLPVHPAFETPGYFQVSLRDGVVELKTLPFPKHLSAGLSTSLRAGPRHINPRLTIF